MSEVKITINPNGPYLVKGPIDLLDDKGNPVPVKGSPIALCRCGGSTMKPFCDGTHSKIGFKGTIEAVKKS